MADGEDSEPFELDLSGLEEFFAGEESRTSPPSRPPELASGPPKNPFPARPTGDSFKPSSQLPVPAPLAKPAAPPERFRGSRVVEERDLSPELGIQSLIESARAEDEERVEELVKDAAPPIDETAKAIATIEQIVGVKIPAFLARRQSPEPIGMLLLQVGTDLGIVM